MPTKQPMCNPIATRWHPMTIRFWLLVGFEWLKKFRVPVFIRVWAVLILCVFLKKNLLVFAGLLYVNGTLDFEVAHEYYLTIEGIRKTSTSFSDVTMVVINVTDINDHMPEFGQDLYIADISEDAAVGEIVLTVRHNHNQGGPHFVGCKPHLTMLHKGLTFMFFYLGF